MFQNILHANDGSASAFKAFELALDLAKQNHCALQMVTVEEIPYLPEYIEEVREDKGASARHVRAVVQRAKAMAERRHVELKTHVLAGHPVRDIVEIAVELKADLLVIGARGHSAFYERMIGSRADRLIQLAPCPVLVVK